MRIQGYEAEDVSSYTNKPHLYTRQSVRARVLPVIASLPVDFFKTVTEDRRVGIHANPLPSGFNFPDPEAIIPDTPSRAIPIREHPAFTRILWWRVVLGRTAIELADGEAFTGTVVHELCHVFLDHHPEDATVESRSRRNEDEAIALTCDLGFRREAEAHFTTLKGWFGDEIVMGRLP
jgi:hypothetical protein